MVPAEAHPPCLSVSLLNVLFSFVALRLELLLGCFFVLFFFPLFLFLVFIFISSWWPGSMVWTLCAFFHILLLPPSDQDIVLM